MQGHVMRGASGYLQLLSQRWAMLVTQLSAQSIPSLPEGLCRSGLWMDGGFAMTAPGVLWPPTDPGDHSAPLQARAQAT